MFKKYWTVLSGSLLFFIFVFYSFLVDINLFKQTDFDTTVRLQDNLSRRFDDFFSFFSTVGSFEVLIIILLIVLVWKRKVIAGFVTFSLFGIFHIIEIFGKQTIENVPPPQFMLRTKHLIEFPQFHVRSEYSYPSGHSGRTIFLSVLLLLFIWKSKQLHKYAKILLSTIIVFFDGFMLLSRIYLGEHWATDVIGGAMLGMSFALISGSLFYMKLAKKNPLKK